MPGYIKEALKEFQHPVPPQPKDLPYPATYTKWGPDSQLTAPKDKSKQLDIAVNRLQQFVGTLIFYYPAVDPTMVKALGSLASQQSEATIQLRRITYRRYDPVYLKCNYTPH